MARPTVIIAIEGVLQKMITTAPIIQGISLYRAFSQTHSIVLVSDFNRQEQTENWLINENLQSHGKVVFNDDPISAYAAKTWRRLSQVSKLARLGHDIHFVIDPDPAVAATLIEHGYNTLLCSYQSYSFPEWLPDYEFKPTPWDDLEATVERQNRLRAEDERLKEEENS